MQNFQKYFSLLFFLAFSFGASAWGGFVTSIYKEPWYSTLIKPGFNPPDLIFPSIEEFLITELAILDLVKLGAIQFILISGANSAANATVNPSSPALAEEIIL